MFTITLHRTTHKSSVQIEVFEMVILIDAIVAYHDGLVVVGAHQFNVQETKAEIEQLINQSVDAKKLLLKEFGLND